LNPELQQYADGIRELVSEIRSFAEIARDASSPDSGAYLEVFSVVSDLARSLERQESLFTCCCLACFGQQYSLGYGRR